MQAVLEEEGVLNGSLIKVDDAEASPAVKCSEQRTHVGQAGFPARVTSSGAPE